MIGTFLSGKKIKLTYGSQLIEIKRDVEPIWSKAVPRWYQLDDAAYALAEWGSVLEIPQPELILFYVKGSSNQTDWSFAHHGHFSPHEFVHTLPSVRFGTLAQVKGWSVPMICVCEESSPLNSAFTESLAAAGRQGTSTLGLVIEPVKKEAGRNRFRIELFYFQPKGIPMDIRFLEGQSSGTFQNLGSPEFQKEIRPDFRPNAQLAPKILRVF
jgi:hypothetical protein